MPHFHESDKSTLLEASKRRDLAVIVEYWKSAKELSDIKYTLSCLNTHGILPSSEVLRIMKVLIEDWHGRAIKVKVGKGPQLVDGLGEISTLMSWFDSVNPDRLDWSAKLALSYIDTLPTTLGQWIRYKTSEEAGLKFQAELEASAIKLVHKEITEDTLEELVQALHE